MAAVSAILLAAGYGTRLYPLTADVPKALLPFGTGVLLDHLMHRLRQVPSLAKVVLVTNRRFAPQFDAWRRARADAVELVDDGTTSPDDRLGALRDLQLAWDRAKGQEALVIGTDNIFTWSLSSFVAWAQAKRPAATIATWKVPVLRDASLYGVVEANRRGRIMRCVEKPAHPRSRAIALCVYYFPAPIRRRLNQCVRETGGADAPGHFLSWLVMQEPVYAYPARGRWFDIGSQESYRQVRAWGALPNGRSRR